jgi:osmotically-inducible protein OsmY
MKPKANRRRLIPRVEAHDSARAAQILNAIECITTASRESLSVTVDNGWVRLEGTLPCWNQKETVDEVVRQLPGVRGLVSLIYVAPQHSYPLNGQLAAKGS